MANLQGRPLILASASPRRHSLLSLSGCRFTVVVPELDETPQPGEAPEALVRRLSKAKAESIGARAPESAVLAADTIVVLPDERGNESTVLNKPVDEEDAVKMLSTLQGRTHLVLTGFSLYCGACSFLHTQVVRTAVEFRPLSGAEIRSYVAAGEPLDKAGAYAAQGGGQLFIRSINGSYSNVVGLPLTEVVELLAETGVWSPGDLTGRG